MSKNSFILHIDSLVILDKMTNEQAGQFIKLIYEYQKIGKIEVSDFAMQMAITPFLNQFERDNEKYENIVERNRGNGFKGGRPKNPKEPKKPNGLITNPPPTKKADNDSDNDSDSVNDNESVKEEFDFFWNLYDKKVGEKKALLVKWGKLKKEDKEKILLHVPKYKAAQPDKRFRKNPEAYLNQKAWNDEIIFSGKVVKDETPRIRITEQNPDLNKW